MQSVSSTRRRRCPTVAMSEQPTCCALAIPAPFCRGVATAACCMLQLAVACTARDRCPLSSVSVCCVLLCPVVESAAVWVVCVVPSCNLELWQPVALPVSYE
jgi:hypothetical protein